jgi:hypothetical protein
MRGGRRKNAGRKSGTPNKMTVARAEGIDVKALAGQYTEMAIAQLAHLAQNATSEQARTAACNSLLDRGHGRPAQQLEHTGKDGGIIFTIGRYASAKD